MINYSNREEMMCDKRNHSITAEKLMNRSILDFGSLWLFTIIDSPSDINNIT